MAVISVYILLIFFEFSKVCSNAFSTYCTLPCPFMGPAQLPGSCGAIQLAPRRPYQMPKTCSFCDYSDDDETSPEPRPEPDPKPEMRFRQRPPYKDPSTSGPPPPKRKPKPPPEDSKPPPEDSKPPREDSKPPPDDSEPPPKKREKSSTPPSPSIQPSRRFFTSLFSIPGAVVDTLVSGEIVL